MASEAGAKQTVLRSVRAALGEKSGATIASAAIEAEWSALPRAYRRASTLGREETLELLEDRLRDYDAVVVRTPAGQVSRQMAKMLADRGKSRLAVPVGLAEAIGEALPGGFEFVIDDGLTPPELDRLDGVVTASTVAIALTGTIVLQDVPGQGRRAATLVPDYHLCVVRASDVVETVPEAMDRLAPTSRLATTFFSGPSATADIEMTRIKGVHGPRFLDVIVVI